MEVLVGRISHFSDQSAVIKRKTEWKYVKKTIKLESEKL